MSKVYLKIKIKSLAEEAKIIRHEEHKWDKKSEIHKGLKEHRRFDVRNEARSSQIAYAFLNGIPYRSIEKKTFKRPDWNRVKKIALKFGPRNHVIDDLEKWANVPLTSE